MDKKLTINANPIIDHSGMPVCQAIKIDKSTAKLTPPATPSQVLPGLTFNASLVLPKALPLKYAPVSVTHTKDMA